MHDIDQLARLKKSGLRIDYDLLDASAIAPDGLHASGRTAAWPKGPGAWIAHCRAAGIRPGMRFSSSALRPFDQAPFDFNAEIFRDFIPTLQSWYDRGIRLFAFDGLDLTVATPETASGHTQDEIVAHNREALSVALTAFRAKNRDAVLLAIAGNGSVPDRSPVFLLLLQALPAGPPGLRPASNAPTKSNPTARSAALSKPAFLWRTFSPRASSRPVTLSNVRRNPVMLPFLPAHGKEIFSSPMRAAAGSIPSPAISMPYRPPTSAGWRA